MDVYEAQAGFDKATTDQIEAENELFDRKETLIEIIGESDIKIDNLKQEVKLSLPSPNKIADWTQNARINNFSIIAALNKTEVSRKNIEIQKSGHLPTLDLVGNYSLEDSNSSFGLRGDTESIGLQLQVPLFQGGVVSSRSKQAQFDYQSSKEELLATERAVKHQTRTAFRDVTSTISRNHSLKAAVDSSTNAVEASMVGFQVGSRTMIDILAEQRNLYRAKRDYSRSRYDYLINSLKLKQTTSSLTEADLYAINQLLK